MTAPDPVSALVAERMKIWEIAVLPIERSAEEHAKLGAQYGALDNRIADMVAPSIEGILAQFELLMGLTDGWITNEWSDNRDGRLKVSIKAGLRNLVPPAAGAKMTAPDAFALGGQQEGDDNAPATLRDLAQIAFDPWPADIVQEFDKVPWQERCETFGINLRLAISLMTKTKAELVGVARGMVEDGNSDALDAAMEVAICIKATGDDLRALAEMASGAYSRYMVALSIVGTE